MQVRRSAGPDVPIARRDGEFFFDFLRQRFFFFACFFDFFGDFLADFGRCARASEVDGAGTLVVDVTVEAEQQPRRAARGVRRDRLRVGRVGDEVRQ